MGRRVVYASPQATRENYDVKELERLYDTVTDVYLATKSKRTEMTCSEIRVLVADRIEEITGVPFIGR